MLLVSPTGKAGLLRLRNPSPIAQNRLTWYTALVVTERTNSITEPIRFAKEIVVTVQYASVRYQTADPGMEAKPYLLLVLERLQE